jgi:hypothetical protein
MITAKLNSINIIPEKGEVPRKVILEIIIVDNACEPCGNEPMITIQMIESEAWHLSEELAEQLSKR